MKKYFIVLSFIFSINAEFFAQHTIQLMNGGILHVISYDDSLFASIHYKADKNYFKNLEIEHENFQLKSDLLDKKTNDQKFTQQKFDALLKRKTKPLKPIKIFDGSVDKEDAFSLLDAKGKEKLYYFYDESLGNYYEVEDMRMFINGEKDARKFYKGNTAFWGGIGFGAVGAYASGLGAATIAMPVVWTLGTLIPTLKIKGKWIGDPKYKQYESYKSGFEKTARTKNIIRGLIGSTIGMVFGAAVYAISNPDEIKQQ